MKYSVAEVNRLRMVGDIVAAFVSRNTLLISDVSFLIQTVHAALVEIETSSAARATPVSRLQQPAVPIQSSVTPNFIICLEDGKKFKSLKRHLRANYDLSADEYRERWGLPKDYPMVAPDYAAARSAIRKSQTGNFRTYRSTKAD